MRRRGDVLILGQPDDFFLANLAFTLRTQLVGRKIIWFADAEHVFTSVLFAPLEPGLVIIEALAISVHQARSLLANAGRTRIVAVCRRGDRVPAWISGADAVLSPPTPPAYVMDTLRGLLMPLPIERSNRRAPLKEAL